MALTVGEWKAFQTDHSDQLPATSNNTDRSSWSMKSEDGLFQDVPKKHSTFMMVSWRVFVHCNFVIWTLLTSRFWSWCQLCHSWPLCISFSVAAQILASFSQVPAFPSSGISAGWPSLWIAWTSSQSCWSFMCWHPPPRHVT